MYKMGGEEVAAMPAQMGQEGNQDERGARRVLSVWPCSVAVELDVFGKDELW